MPLHRSCIRFLGLMPVIAVCLVIAGCTKDLPTKNTDQFQGVTNRIVTVSYPLQYLTQRIAGDSVQVDLPASGAADPQNWRPTPSEIGKMQTADLIIANGAGADYAKWLTLVSLPDSKIRNTASRGLSLKDYIAVEDVTVVHSHGPEGEHSHPTMVARTWLDPAIAKKQSIYIADQLKSVYPDRADVFQENLKSLVKDLDELSGLLDFKSKTGLRILTATPNPKFFSRAIGLPDQHLAWFKTPTVEQAKTDLESLQTDSAEIKPGLILFDNVLPNEEILQLLTSRKLSAIAFDLIDQKPSAGDFLTELRANIETLSKSMIELE